MAQVLKDDVRQRIEACALRAFAKDGYRGASMAAIAAAAGVSTGNLYRYHGGKADLYRAVVPDAFAHALSANLQRRVEALAGVDDVRTLPPDAPFHAVSGELLAFCIENRLRVVVLLGRSKGTPHERFAERTVADLADVAIAHFRAMRPGLEVTPAGRYVLQRIYGHLVETMVDVLARHASPRRIREAVGGYSRYHLAGLKAFFEEEWAP